MTALWMWICCVLLLLICGMTRVDSGDTTTVRCSSGIPDCPTDYTYPIDSCRGNNPITCTRYVWNREQIRGRSLVFPIAIRKEYGTSICVVVKPTTNNKRFIIDLIQGRRIINHFEARKSYIKTETFTINQYDGDSWDGEMNFRGEPWPFSVGSEATVRITSYKPENDDFTEIAYYVNGKGYAGWNKPLYTPVQQANEVLVWGDAEVMGLNTLCTDSNWRPA